MDKNYMSKIEALNIDEISRKLQEYSIRIKTFGMWEAHGQYSIVHNSFPYHRIIFIINGEMDYESNGFKTKIAKNDVIYTPCNTLYSAFADETSEPMFLYIYFEIDEIFNVEEFINMLSKYNRRRIYKSINSKIEYYMHSLFDEYKKKQPGYYIKSNYLLCLIIIEILRISDFTLNIHGNKPSIYETTTKMVINKATSYIAANLDHPLRLDEVATMCNISLSYLYKIFKMYLHQSPSEYILDAKITMVCQLLKNTEKSITEIASELQFSSSNHLSNVFYKKKGIRPKDYRKKASKK